ncbi:MAG: 2-phosphosulfolactate phosphatase [Acidobacteriota bacterium]
MNETGIRFAWGMRGLSAALADAGTVVIVDVLSFSTCVDVAVSRGAQILPAAIPGQAATIAGRRGAGRYSLSPESFLSCDAGERIVLPSPNGGALASACGGKTTYTSCLRNATAVARAAARQAAPILVVAAGERRPDGSLRPALEDLLGAGAVIRHLPGRHSPDTAAAAGAFDALRHSLADALRRCASGQELVARGYARDVAIAAELDVSQAVPQLQHDAFVGARSM